MAIVPRVRRSGKTTYYVVFEWKGKPVWERVGTDKRVALSRERQRKQEVLDGTYLPDTESAATLVSQYLTTWGETRKNRSASADRQRLRDHVLSHTWFADMAMIEVRPIHIRKIVDELLAAADIAPKTVKNVFGALRTAFRDALMNEIIVRDPCILPREYIKGGRQEEPVPYTKAEAVQLMHAPTAPEDMRVFAALALYTGMRQGEICGRRWRDLDEASGPLPCLTIKTQYKDRPLKTDNPRKAPVHPALARILRQWRETGFEFAYLRPPQPDDPIVPMRFSKTTRGVIRPHTRSSSYKAFVKLCGAASVAPGDRVLHRTRNTFITWTRRDGGKKDLVEKITHNAKGDIIDQYTQVDWEPLCETVSCLRLDVRPVLPLGGVSSGNGGPAFGQWSSPNVALLHGSTSVTLGSIPSASTTKYLEKGSSKKTRQSTRQGSRASGFQVATPLRECVRLAEVGTPEAEAGTVQRLTSIVRRLRKATPPAPAKRTKGAK